MVVFNSKLLVITRPGIDSQSLLTTWVILVAHFLANTQLRAHVSTSPIKHPMDLTRPNEAKLICVWETYHDISTANGVYKIL